MKNVFEDVWVLLLNELFESGEDVEKDDARIKEVIGVHKWIPSPYKNSLPLIYLLILLKRDYLILRVTS